MQLIFGRGMLVQLSWGRGRVVQLVWVQLKRMDDNEVVEHIAVLWEVEEHISCPWVVEEHISVFLGLGVVMS